MVFRWSKDHVRIFCGVTMERETGQRLRALEAMKNDQISFLKQKMCTGVIPKIDIVCCSVLILQHFCCHGAKI